MKPFAPPPPPGAQPPPLWGDEDHVRELLGDRVADVRTTTAAVPVDRFANPEAFLHFWREAYGPTVAAYRAIGDDAERSAALDAALTGLARGAPKIRRTWAGCRDGLGIPGAGRDPALKPRRCPTPAVTDGGGGALARPSPWSFRRGGGLPRAR